MNSNGLLLRFTSGNQTWHHGKLGTHRAFWKWSASWLEKCPLGPIVTGWWARATPLKNMNQLG